MTDYIIRKLFRLGPSNAVTIPPRLGLVPGDYIKIGIERVTPDETASMACNRCSTIFFVKMTNTKSIMTVCPVCGFNVDYDKEGIQDENEN